MDSGKATKLGGQWFALAAVVSWGTTGTAQAFAPEGAVPAAIVAIRLVIGGVALLALAVMRGGLANGKCWPGSTTALTAVCMAAYQLFFFAGVSRTSVAVGTLVAIGSAPILAGKLSFLV